MHPLQTDVQTTTTMPIAQPLLKYGRLKTKNRHFIRLCTPLTTNSTT